MNESMENDLEVKISRIMDYEFAVAYIAKEIILRSARIGVNPHEFIEKIIEWVEILEDTESEANLI